MRRVMENVELIRQYRGIRKKRLAEASNISAMAYSRLSNGTAKLSADLLVNFAHVLMIKDYNIFFDDKLTDSVVNNREEVRA